MNNYRNNDKIDEIDLFETENPHKNITAVPKDEKEKELDLTIYPTNSMEEKNIPHEPTWALGVNLVYNVVEGNLNNRHEIKE